MDCARDWLSWRILGWLNFNRVFMELIKEFLWDKLYWCCSIKKNNRNEDFMPEYPIALTILSIYHIIKIFYKK
jgi:hypothetical protein